MSNLMMSCPLCDKFFAPDPAVVEIEIRLKGELGGDRTRNVYCIPCGKLISEKGVSHWDLVLEAAIRKEINPESPITVTEDLVREILGNLGASQKLQEALVEHMVGKEGTFRGLRYEFPNRDRIVAFLISKSKDLL